MEEFDIKNVIISKQLEDSDNYKLFKEKIYRKKISIILVEVNDNTQLQRIQIEKNLYFEFLWPESKKQILENSLNNNSVVCKLNYKNFSCMFTGDIEEEAERQILKKYKEDINILKATILKIAHHGSKTSSNTEFIQEVKPKIALIGVGKNNNFGHPNEEVIDRLKKIGCNIYRTDNDGEITILVNIKGEIRVKKFIKDG